MFCGIQAPKLAAGLEVEPVERVGGVLQHLQLGDPGQHLGQDLGRRLVDVEEPRAALGDEQRGRTSENADAYTLGVGELEQALDEALDLALHVAARGHGEDDVGVLHGAGEQLVVEQRADHVVRALNRLGRWATAVRRDGVAAAYRLANDGFAAVTGAAEDLDACHEFSLLFQY